MTLTEAELEAMLRNTVRLGEPYARADLLALFHAAGLGDDEAAEAFVGMRWYAENRGSVGSIDVLTTGNKKGRRYTFAATERGAVDAGVEVAAAESTASISPRGGNDHPEDRAHIAAHLALLLHRRCVAVSLPKTVGTRSRTNSATHQNDNPDIIGVARRRWEPTRATVEVPGWMTNAPRAEHLLIAAEVKPGAMVQNASQLYWAMVEARHNTRYFDEGWLLAPIPEYLHANARALGEEYGIGVLSWLPTQVARADVLWIPATRDRSSDVRDYLSRMDADRARERVAELEGLRAQADRIEAPIRGWALERLLTNQLADSMLSRLPASVRETLRDPSSRCWADDSQALVQAILDVALEHYDVDEVDPDELAPFVRTRVLEPARRLENVAGQKLAAAIEAEVRTRFDERALALRSIS